MAIGNKPSQKPAWIPDNTTNITDPGSKATNGWLTGDTAPSPGFNWFWNLISQWIDYIDETGHFVANYTINVAVGQIDTAIAEIAALPRDLNGYTLTIDFATGTHEPSDTIAIEDFRNGDIVITGGSSSAKTIIDTSVNGGTEDCLKIRNCSANIEISGYSATYQLMLESATAIYEYTVFLSNNIGNIDFRYVDMVNTTANATAIIANKCSNVSLRDTDLEGGTSGIYLICENSRMYVDSGCQRLGGVSIKALKGSYLSYDVSEPAFPGMLKNETGSLVNLNTYYLELDDITTTNPAALKYIYEGATIVIYNTAFAAEQARVKVLNVVGGRLYYEQISGNTTYTNWNTAADTGLVAGFNITAADSRANTLIGCEF